MNDWVVESHIAVRGDIDDAISYYESLNPNLGSDFNAAVTRCLNQLPVFPEAHREYLPGWRRIIARPFPYLILYTVQEQTVFVTALVHSRSNPTTVQAILTERTN